MAPGAVPGDRALLAAGLDPAPANLRAGRVDLSSGWVLAGALSVGILVGTPLAHWLSQRAMRRLVVLAMLVAALLMVGRLAGVF